MPAGPSWPPSLAAAPVRYMLIVYVAEGNGRVKGMLKSHRAHRYLIRFGVISVLISSCVYKSLTMIACNRKIYIHIRECV